MSGTGVEFAPAFAKINLSLEALRRREDGYHELASVMQTVSLHDTLRFQETEEGALAFSCDVDALDSQENLALRAVHLAASSLTGVRSAPGLRLELHKEIPFQAGLGGGSSDAAGVLMTLNRRWGLGLDMRRLEALGATLGSDVPFFMRGGTALITGRGEHVEPLPDAPACWIVLAIPPVAVSTALVFKSLTLDDFSSGSATTALVQDIRAGKAPQERHMVNTLESRAIALFPAIAETRDILLRAGAPFVRMSGSGSALFAPFERLQEAARVVDIARAAGAAVHLTRTVSAREIARLAGSDV